MPIDCNNSQAENEQLFWFSIAYNKSKLEDQVPNTKNFLLQFVNDKSRKCYQEIT